MVCLVICAVFALGCVGINPQARLDLQQPADCATAAEDIQSLQAARQAPLRRVGAGLQAIVPVAVVLSLLRDIVGKPYRSIYLDHWRVAFGSYNRKIDARVTELENCGM